MVISAPSAALPPLPEAAEGFMNRRLSLRHLKVLKAISEAGSLSEAADLLHVTQPAVSKALAEIETGLGQTLFQRRGRSLRATPMGLRLLELAHKLEADLQRAKGDIASLIRGASGELQIGATNAALAQVLPDAMAAMKREYPNITLSVRTHALTSLAAELREGRLDLVIARMPPQEMPPELEAYCLLPQREVLVISKDHPLAGAKTKLSWDTLIHQAWIWPLPGTRSRLLQDRLWQRMKLPLPTNLIETGDITLALSMMKRMPLLNIMPQHVARVAAQNDLVKILPLEVDLGLADLTLWHLAEPQTEVVQRFKQLLSEAAART
jgi:DNA-binding transcriptional LysR family regulator